MQTKNSQKDIEDQGPNLLCSSARYPKYMNSLFVNNSRVASTWTLQIFKKTFANLLNPKSLNR